MGSVSSLALPSCRDCSEQLLLALWLDPTFKVRGAKRFGARSGSEPEAVQGLMPAASVELGGSEEEPEKFADFVVGRPQDMCITWHSELRCLGALTTHVVLTLPSTTKTIFW